MISAIVLGIKAIHICVLFFVCLGWLFKSPKWLWTHVIFIPLMHIHWKTNNGQCFLTEIEHSLTRETAKNQRQGEFTRELFESIGFAPSDQELKLIIYSLIALSWLISCFKLYKLKKYPQTNPTN